MSRHLISTLSVLLALLPGIASADDAQGQSVPCVGPMCMLTPIYKLGSMMPEMSTAAPPQPVQPPPAQSQPVQPQGQDTPQASAAVSTAAPQEAPDKTATVPAVPSAAAAAAASANEGDDRESARIAPAAPNPARRRIAHRVSRRPARSASSVRPAVPDTAAATVTVAANGAEFARLLRLAAVVKAPPIRVIPAVAFVDGCRQKPADFVVDTMANPGRVGPAIPLFTESLIILARKDIHDLQGLRGRRVSFGLPGGSSQQVAGRLFRSLAIDVSEQPLELENALDGLALGDLDAVAFLMPRGFDGLAHHDPQLQLLPLPERMIPPDGLKLSRIEPSAYLGGTWSTANLSVVTVDAVLSPSRAAGMQPNAQAVYAALDRRSSELAGNGFDLIGGSGLTTMRSIAKDASPTDGRQAGSGC